MLKKIVFLFGILSLSTISYADEAGNTMYNPKALGTLSGTSSKSISGVIDYEGDKDWFVIDYYGEGDLTFSTSSNIDTYGGIHVYENVSIYNPTSTVGATEVYRRYNDDGGDTLNFKLTHTAELVSHFTRYFILVAYNENDGTGNYTLNIQATE